ncbi:radial spoke head protein 6 homolog A [Phymastichus coffea]|uniref:radial spoke head protein 6 homolog A n=1 Tax=Phymastichus coffea TaxID=108790 RepID=UPI00273AE8AC|nr:radial spoke head protein 6 homolog A [Phymastichus coffea]
MAGEWCKVPPTDDEAPSIKREAEGAKLYLRKFCPAAGDNLHDHLSEVLKKILTERPNDAITAFEEYSRKLREDKFRMQGDCLRDLHVPRPQFKDAQKLIDLFKVHLAINEDYRSVDEGTDDAVQTRAIIPNLFELLFYSEQVDIGLPRTEVVLLNLAIRKLIAKIKVEDVRFWGKILGRSKNYYVIEASLSDFELERRLEELERAQQKSERENADDANGDAKEAQQEVAEKEALEAALATKLSDSAGENEAGFAEEDDTLKLVFPPIPENTWLPPPKVPPEKLGTGANAKVYFVCNSPGLDDWVELPAVTPEQIVIARQTIYVFTGNLEADIRTFPPFPGNEKNYLRAQIARIGAATHVSPIGYFTFGNRKQDDEEMEDEESDAEDEEEEEDEADVVINRHYEQPAIRDLIESSNWCHHSPCILAQGRVIWQDPGKAGAEEGDEEDEGEDEAEEGDEADDSGNEKEEQNGSEKDKGIEKEIGPPLLTPLSEDTTQDWLTPWTGRLSSKIQPDTAVALIRSNVWPGAFAIAADKKFFNVYIGWGHKHNAYNYSPITMPPIENQYPIDSEPAEIQDPTFDEEETYRISQLPPSDDDEEEDDESEKTVDSEED